MAKIFYLLFGLLASQQFQILWVWIWCHIFVWWYIFFWYYIGWYVTI